MEQLVQVCRQKKYTISSVESLSAGLFAAQIANVPHASEVLYGSLVTYQTACKVDVLKVDPTILAEKGVVSQECALEMAKCGSKMFGTDVCISCTGNAGPDVMENKAVGLVFSCIAFRGTYYEYQWNFDGDRNDIRKQVCDAMKKEILNLIQEYDKYKQRKHIGGLHG